MSSSSGLQSCPLLAPASLRSSLFAFGRGGGLARSSGRRLGLGLAQAARRLGRPLRHERLRGARVGAVERPEPSDSYLGKYAILRFTVTYFLPRVRHGILHFFETYSLLSDICRGNLK